MVRPRKELDPKLWHIGRLDLAIEGGARGFSAQCVAVARTARAARIGTTQSALRSLTSTKGRSFGLSYAQIAASSNGKGTID